MKRCSSFVSGEGPELSISPLSQPLLELVVSVVTRGFGCALNKTFLSDCIPITYKSLAVERKDLQVLSP